MDGNDEPFNLTPWTYFYFPYRTFDLGDHSPVGIIRVRSDVERKRLYGLAADARLLGFARTLLRSGSIVIVDAAFLRQVQRNAFRVLAQRLGLPFFILDCQPSEDILLKRVLSREREGRDASEANAAVLTHQLATHEPLTEAEKGYVIIIDTTHGIDGAHVAATLGGPLQTEQH